MSVVGRLRKPGAKTVKRLMIFSGHDGSAPEDTWLRFLFALFKTRGRKNGGNLPGAADNLSACALAVAMGRFLC